MSVHSDVRVRIYEFAVALGSAGRLFTLEQIASHPDLSWRTQPSKRASEILTSYPDAFESAAGPIGECHRWRLTKREKFKRGITWRNVDAHSQRVWHWIGLGDVWSALTFAGGRPSTWTVEQDHIFDAYCVWRDKAYLMEYQRSVLSTRVWKRKWEKRLEWYRAQQYEVKPYVVLINLTTQQKSTICAPPGTIHVRRVEDLPRALMKL